TQIALAYASVPIGDADYYAAMGAVNVLSGGMSARLFTEIREKRGLCYAVWATYQTFKDRASILCYAGTTNERAQETLDVTLAELKRLQEGVESEEVERVQAGLKSSLIMQEESTSSRAGSVALGFFVRTGARDETGDVSGVTHFLEHMVFKGTPRRSALDVNRDFDKIGAHYNAFTSEENTVFYAGILPEYIPQAVDILADILRPSLRVDDFEMEKNVIIEEIGMYEDQPTWSAYD